MHSLANSRHTRPKSPITPLPPQESNKWVGNHKASCGTQLMVFSTVQSHWQPLTVNGRQNQPSTLKPTFDIKSLAWSLLHVGGKRLTFLDAARFEKAYFSLIWLCRRQTCPWFWQGKKTNMSKLALHGEGPLETSHLWQVKNNNQHYSLKTCNSMDLMQPVYSSHTAWSSEQSQGMATDLEGGGLIWRAGLHPGTWLTHASQLKPLHMAMDLEGRSQLDWQAREDITPLHQKQGLAINLLQWSQCPLSCNIFTNFLTTISILHPFCSFFCLYPTPYVLVSSLFKIINP